MSIWDGRTANAGTARLESFRYQKIVREYEAKQAAGQLKPQESKSEHVPPAARVRPSIEREIKAALAEADERTARLPDQSKASSVIGVAVADHASEINAVFTQTDQQLSQAAGATR
jgi:hypothetical protein